MDHEAGAAWAAFAYVGGHVLHHQKHWRRKGLLPEFGLVGADPQPRGS